MKRYVNGFMFDHFLQSVMLIKKLTPKWQAGHWNGIGGKIEPQEAPITAMVREFKEETTIQTIPEDWEHVFTLGNDYWEMFVYRAVSPKTFEWEEAGEPSPTEETVSLWEIEDILAHPTKISNLNWIIPMLRDPSLVTPFQIRHVS